VSPIEQLDLIYDLGASWIDSSEALPLAGLVSVAQQEGATAENEVELRQTVKAALRRLYEPSKKHVEQRIEWEQKLG
jgi:hypothetical protein